MIEFAGEAERVEHAIDTVGFFADVFEEEDFAVGFDFVGRAHCRDDDGNVAADEAAAGFAGVHGDGVGDVFEEFIVVWLWWIGGVAFRSCSRRQACPAVNRGSFWRGLRQNHLAAKGDIFSSVPRPHSGSGEWNVTRPVF